MLRKAAAILMFSAWYLSAQPIATVQITRTPKGAAVPSNFMGLSIQQSVALKYFGPPSAANSVLFTMLKNLGTGTLRIGGNAADYSCWSGETVPDPSVCQYTTTSSDFDSWANAAAKTAWPAIIGVSLVQAESPGAPQYISDEITTGILPAFKNHPAASLLAIETGNEINLYKLNPAYRPPTYSLNNQISDLLSYMTVLKANSATSGIPIAAPAYWVSSTGTINNLDTLMAGVVSCAGCNPANIGLVTLHEYPLSVAGGNVVTIAQLLSPSTLTGIEQPFTQAVSDMNKKYNLAVQIDETNSVSSDPGQPGVCDVQASGMWALDYALDMARIGVHRMNFHIHDGSYYDPIAITSSGPGLYSNEVRPEYYAMYAFKPAVGKQFLPVTISTAANIRAYALSTCPTCAITVFLINKDLSAAGQVQITLSKPATSATYLELTAPSLSSYASDVTYGGVQFNNTTGALTGTPQTIPVTPDGSGIYTVTLDNASAGILTIQP